VVLGKNADPDAGEPRQELRNQALKLRDQDNEDSWALAAVLLEIRKSGIYHEWVSNKGTKFTSWREYVEQELDFHIRRTQQLLQVEEWLSGLPKASAAWFRKLSYTKARMLCPYVTAENAAEWRVKVEDKTVMAIDEMLHEHAKELGADPEGKGADAPSDRQPPFKAVLTPAQRATVDRAMAVCAKMLGCDTTKDRYGQMLDLICTSFLSTNGGFATVQDFLAAVEDIVGVSLIGYDRSLDAVVFGSETLDAMGKDEGVNPTPADQDDIDEEDDAGVGDEEMHQA